MEEKQLAKGILDFVEQQCLSDSWDTRFQQSGHKMSLQFLQNLVLARANGNMILMDVSCFSCSVAVEFYGMESTK